MKDLVFTLRKLKHIIRCSTYRRIHDENVAEHSYYVSILAMMIADELNTLPEYAGKISVEKVIRNSLLHDADEALTGDIIFPVKHHNKHIHEAIKSTASFMWDELFKGLPQSVQMYKEIASDCKKDLEGSCVALADMLELCLYCYEEVSLGNTNMKEIMSRGVSIIARHPFYKQLKSLQEFVAFLVRLEFSEMIKLNMIHDAVADSYSNPK